MDSSKSDIKVPAIIRRRCNTTIVLIILLSGEVNVSESIRTLRKSSKEKNIIMKRNINAGNFKRAKPLNSICGVCIVNLSSISYGLIIFFLHV